MVIILPKPKGSKSPHRFQIRLRFDEDDGMWVGTCPNQPSIPEYRHANMGKVRDMTVHNVLAGYITKQKNSRQPIMLTPMEDLPKPDRGIEIMDWKCS